MIQHVWVFAGPYLLRPAETETWLQRIRELRVTDVVIALNLNTDRNFQVRGSPGRVIEVATALQQMDVEVHLMTWLRPTQQFITDCARTMLPLAESAGATSVLFDVEGEWRSAPVNHFRVVEHHFVPQFSSPPCWLGVTSFVNLLNSVIPLAERCHYVLPQAYSVDLPQMGRWKPPGVTQRRAYAQWRDLTLAIQFRGDFLPPSPMVMGLACFHPLFLSRGMSQWDAMQAAVSAVEELSDPPIYEVAYWQLRTLYEGRRGFEERRDFVQHAALNARRAQVDSEFESLMPLAPA